MTNKTELSGLSGIALNYAFLMTMYADPPAWKVDGETLLINAGEAAWIASFAGGDEYQSFDPVSVYGEEHCRRVVASSLGALADIPEELTRPAS